jgi:hypothetical protein
MVILGEEEGEKPLGGRLAWNFVILFAQRSKSTAEMGTKSEPGSWRML